MEKNRTPVDGTITANDPPPQTMCGVLSQNGGFGGKHVSLKGDFYDVEQACSMWRLKNKFNVSVSDTAGTSLFATPVTQEATSWISLPPEIHWRDYAIYHGDFIQWEIVYRFWVVKPERVPGKLFIEYTPQGTQGQLWDTKMRFPQIEWDFNKRDFIDVRLPILKRYSKIPTRSVFTSITNVCKLQDDWLNIMGILNVEVSVPIKPGSIYPDNYEIFVFTKMEKVVLEGPADFRLYGSDFMPCNVLTSIR